MTKNKISAARFFFIFIFMAIAAAALLPKTSEAFWPFSLFTKKSAPEIGSTTDLRYYAINVGQGDSSLFIFPDGRTMLIDAGTPEAGETVVDFLKGKGIKKIDLLVATHPHADHIGGIQDVLDEFEIGKIWDSGFVYGSSYQKRFYKTIKEKNIPFGRPKRGYSEKFGNVTVDVLAPAEELHATHSDANNNSIVLKITYGKVSFLMPGDMEREERRTIEPLPQATVLKAAHHGSKNGTDARVLREVSPEAIVISCAKTNDYGHPHKKVVKAIARAGIMRFDTSDGTVQFSTDGRELKYQKDRVVRSNEGQKY
jgi:competence protein ComEC